MNLLQRIRDAYDTWEARSALAMTEAELKATIRVGGTGMSMVHSDWVRTSNPGNLYSNWYSGQAYFVGTRFDYQTLVGPLYQNSAYLACLMAYMDAFSQAPVCLKEMKDGQKVRIEQGDAREDIQTLLDLFETINPEDDAVTLIDATLIDYLGPGNAYWIPVFDAAGNPRELQYVPESSIKPITPQMQGRIPEPGERRISYYELHAGGPPQRVEVEDIIHIRLGKNPQAPHLGLGRGAWLMREMFADNEATNYTSSILYQMGVAQRIFMPKMYRGEGGFDMTAPFDGQKITQGIAAASSGDNRGKSVAIESLAEIHESDVTPEKMALDVIRHYPESRVAAVMRVPANMAGLLSGKDVATYANFEVDRTRFWQDSVIPSMRRIRSQVTRQLIWRNERYKARQIWFGFNYDEVPALQVDEAARDKNIRENFKYGLLDAAEARSIMGMDPKPEDEGRMYSPTPGAEPEEEDPEERTIREMDEGRKEYVSPLQRLTAELTALESLNGSHS